MSNLKKGVLGSVLLVGQSFLNKAVGLVSTLILARVLLPEDFGIVAIATLIIGFFEILSNTGAVQYLLKEEHINDSDVNTSWTINIIIRFFLSLIIYFASYYAADFYGDDRLSSLIQILALVFFIKAWENPAIVYLMRNQEYTDIVKVSVVGKVLAVCGAVSIALYLESYWALVVGQTITVLASLIGYYLVYPFSLRFELTNAKKQWSFSGWIIPQSILGYFRTQLDTFLVSSFFGKTELGSYHTMKYIAYIPTSDLMLPITQTFLVEMRKAAVEANNFNNVFNGSLLITLLLAAPIAAFLYQFHMLTTLILLGANWVEYSQLLAIFSLLIPAAVIHRHCCRTLMIYHKPKNILIYEIITFLIIYGVLFFVGLDDLYIFTYFRVGMEQVLSLFFLVYISIEFTNFVTLLKLLLGVFTIFFSCIVTIYLFDNISEFSDYAILDLGLKGVSFFCFFYFLFIISYCLLLRHFSEWKYIAFLVKRLISPVIDIMVKYFKVS
jgi:O-antigen/teichoic acid export membrane protein